MELLRKLVENEFQKIMNRNTKAYFLANTEKVYLLTRIYKFIMSDMFNEEEYCANIFIGPAPLISVYEWYIQDNNKLLEEDISLLLKEYENYKEIN